MEARGSLRRSTWPATESFAYLAEASPETLEEKGSIVARKLCLPDCADKGD